MDLVLSSNTDVVKDSLRINFNKIDTDGINICIYLYTTNTIYDDYFIFKQEINDCVLKVLEAEKVKLAYPGRRVYLNE